jgi:virginiamycin B lyase
MGTSSTQTLAVALLLILPASLPAQSPGFSQVVLPPVPPGPLPTINPYNSITTGPDGALWFTGLMGFTNIGRISSTGEVTTFPLPQDLYGFDDTPSNITAGPDGALWFSVADLSASGGAIGRLTTDGVFTFYTLSTSQLVLVQGMTAGPDGALWFTNSIIQDEIGRITTDGVITEYPLPNPTGSGPTGITVGPDGALWFTENIASNIGRITTDGVITEYPFPTHPANAAGITMGPDGALWFVENYSNKIGRMTTSGAVTEYAIPTSNSNAFNIASNFGYLWFPEFAANQIGMVSTGGVITESAAPVLKNNPDAITVGPGSSLWFTTTNEFSIAEAEIVQVVQPTASLGADPASGGPMKLITLTGSGFSAGETVNLNLDSAGGFTLETVPADGTGSFDVSLRLHQAPAGLNDIFAVGQTSGKMGIASFTVSAILTVEPSTVSAGGVVTVDGYGFDPLEEVTVTLSPGGEGLQAKTSRLGSFHDGTAIAYTIPSGTPPGVYEIVGKGATSGEVTEVSITVE